MNFDTDTNTDTISNTISDTSTSLTPNPQPEEFSAATLRSSTVRTCLRIKLPGRQKTDRSQSEAVNTQSQAQGKVAKLIKTLYPGSPTMQKVADWYGAVQKFNRQNSRPWDEGGWRILMASDIIEYTGRMEEFRKEFEQLKVLFEAELPTMRTRAAFISGALYNPDDYPSDAEIMDSWGWSLTVAPHEGDGFEDYRFSIDEAAREQLKQQFAESRQEQYNVLLKGILGDVEEKLRIIVKQLTPNGETNEQGEPKIRRLHASLLSNVSDIVGTLEKYNIYGDPTVSEIARASRHLVANNSVEQWREGEGVKEKALGEVEDILAKFDF